LISYLLQSKPLWPTHHSRVSIHREQCAHLFSILHFLLLLNLYFSVPVQCLHWSYVWSLGHVTHFTAKIGNKVKTFQNICQISHFIYVYFFVRNCQKSSYKSGGAITLFKYGKGWKPSSNVSEFTNTCYLRIKQVMEYPQNITLLVHSVWYSL